MVNIVHNEVCIPSYTAISVGYGWTSTINPMSANHIDSNDVHNFALLLGDAGGIYTLSNQQPNSTIGYNYLHDYFPVAWADYGIMGFILDEQTSGYSVIGNVFVNAAGDQTVHTLYQATNNTASNNDGTSATTIANAGIEAAYRDIKNFSIPTTGINSAPRLMQKTVSARSGSTASYRVYSLSGRYLGAIKSLSSKAAKPLAGGICLVRPENLTPGSLPGGVRMVLIAK